MRNSTIVCAIFCVFANFSNLGAAHADLVGVQYFDKGSFPGEGGPLWTGVVDTVANKLRIDTWTELPGHGANFWTPANVPMVWTARDATGAVYDVPDSFGQNGIVNFGNDASPANDFAFISPVSLQDMGWFGFDSNTGAPDTSVVLDFTFAGVDLFPGWGGDAFRDQNGNIVYRVKQPNSSSTDGYDYRMMPVLPTSATTIQSSTGGTVTVTSREVTSAVMVGVPEASPVLGGMLVCALCAGATWIQKKRRALELQTSGGC